MIFKDSRFEPLDLVILPHKSGKMIETFPPIRINRDTPQDSIVHTVAMGDRIESICYLYYGQFIPIWWWAICNANPWLENPHELPVGKNLIIPTPTFVRGVVDGSIG